MGVGLKPLQKVRGCEADGQSLKLGVHGVGKAENVPRIALLTL